MTLQAFQHALSELVASPDTCVEVRRGDTAFLARFDLSPVEKNRLLEAVQQPGMSVSCSIYRSNRMTPLYTMLHFTCVLLGQRLKPVVDDFWATADAPDLQFRPEIERFARYLKRRLDDGTLTHPCLNEVLDFELAMNALQFIPRSRILQQVRSAQAEAAASPLQVNPLLRIVHFEHDPAEVLGRIGREEMLPEDLPTGNFFVLLDGSEEDIRLSQLDPSFGAVLLRMQTDPAYAPPAEIADELVRAGLAVPCAPATVTAS